MRHIIQKIFNYIDPWGDYVFGSTRPFSTAWVREKFKALYLRSYRQTEIRYQPILDELNVHMAPNSSILEVGCGTIGLSLYTDRQIVGADLCVNGPRFSNLKLVKANVTDLPFKDGEFDLAFSLDTLEHLPRHMRRKAVKEICRVARKKAIIGVPCGAKAREFETKARKVYLSNLAGRNWNSFDKKGFMGRNRYLWEHHAYGLPTEEEMREDINQCIQAVNGRYNVTVKGNESCYVWYFGVLGQMRYNFFQWAGTVLIFVLFFRILLKTRLGGYYRKIFVIDKI